MNRVAPGREDDWYCCRCSLGRECRSGVSNDHGRQKANQLGHQRRQAITPVLGPAVFDRDVLAVDETRLLQTLVERDHQALRVSGRGAPQEADYRHRRLLRPRCHRPRGRAAKQRDELPPPDHSITSSARASSVDGTSMPSVLAVLRLMTSSYLVGACTGRSAGFSPFRMRST